MRQKIITLFILSIFLSGIWSLSGCKKEETAEGIDKQLLDMAQSTDGFTWYKNTGVFLDKSSGSGHSFPFLRTRFNSEASTKLDSTGKIKEDAIFEDGSFILKELYNGDNSFARYAMLYKQSNNANADANGWVWGYINADGSVAVTATEKGSQCINCHSQEGSIDYMLMNKFFP